MVEEFSHLYFHVFAVEVPEKDRKLNTVDVFPDGDVLEITPFYGTKPLILSDKMVLALDHKISSNPWSIVEALVKEAAIDYNYHGVFMKADNFGKFYFKGEDLEVKRKFNGRRGSKKFGLD